MVQLLKESINLLNLELEEEEIEKVVELWYPQARDNVLSIQDNQVYILQSVNTQTQFVTIRKNNTERLTISFQEMKENYVPVLTFSQAKVIIDQLPPEYEGVKEKFIQAISKEDDFIESLYKGVQYPWED